MFLYRHKLIFLTLVAISFGYNCFSQKTNKEPISYVNCMTGTGGDANLLPVASVPFGMVQVGPDTHLNNSGYKYSADKIIGFSHTHMSGGGCNDFKDIMFFPVSDSSWIGRAIYPENVFSTFSHKKERAEPGYYEVKLLNSDINVEITATNRCGMHRYSYPKGKLQQLIVDLKYGHNRGCTVCKEYNYDTVRISHVEIVNNYTIKGYRISDGWLKGVTVNFYAQFSKPFTSVNIYKDQQLKPNLKELTGRDIRLVLQFENDGKPVVARVGISPVSMEGAMKNLQEEVNTWNFDLIKKNAQQAWNKELKTFQVSNESLSNKAKFYTFLYRSLFYPMLYSDVSGEFRSSDNKVHAGNFRYFGGVLGLWDTFRAQNPLITILHPDVMNDLMKTFLEHYKNCGQLPQWTGAGVENLCMIGYPAMPVIADAFNKGIRDYDVPKLYEAMKVSANVDTFGFSEGNGVYKGTYLYKHYGFVPCDMDINSVSKTLEFCYGDWCIAQMAKMLGHKEDYNFYINRAGWYKHLYDPQTKLLRPKDSSGKWRTPFDPVFTNHYHAGDDYCEGTAYQWLFFVPHDPQGLATLMGGKGKFAEQLDSLFVRSPEIHDGGKGSPDLNPKGMIGQYAHANEPGHHTIYLYNSVGQPWKTQKWINYVLRNLYNTSPDGLCGNDDTGQMSAWFVFSAMGFYPETHGQGIYYIGTPLFKNLMLKHKNGTLSIKAHNLSEKNIYIQSVKLNGKYYGK
ncbi:MAG: GH92 family glycosyl hydrolase, partial [Bacteroidota bacterium]|nr:GH92 family glycosyl hydrolase [Bacteroidota bacterium]